jgi:phosphoglucomutase
MDCSSPDAMASLIANRDRYQIATGNDADADRHGIVTPDAGLMNPNHYLAVAIDYLYTHRPSWPDGVGGRQDRGQLVDHRPGGRGLSAAVGRGAGRVQVVRRRPDRRHHRLRRRGIRGSVVPAPRRIGVDHRQGRHHPGVAGREILAVTGATPSQRYQELTEKYGAPLYARIDAPADREQKAGWRSCHLTRSVPLSWPGSRSRRS